MQEVISQADVAAGLSLGEYTALTFAGALKCAPAFLMYTGKSHAGPC